ncbi:MAG: hypothetical protein JXA20_15315 [Spirochaetes bacterium]|nr:hypothetical protein [Spirochaetota bacterium]
MSILGYPIMHEKLNISNIILAGIFTSLGVVIPMLFHLLGLGAVFLPMYLPLSVGAYMLSTRNALIMGIFTPLLSALITGMPPFYPPVAFLMMVQLGVFCTVISLMQHRLKAPVLLSLLAAIALDRALLVAAYYIAAPLFSVSFGIISAYDILKSLPGILIMLVMVPVAVPRGLALLRRNSLNPYGGRKMRGDHPHDA